MLGFAIVGLETGFILAFRAGWKISVANVVANITLAIILIFVGVILYKESISIKQIAGIVCCAFGLALIMN